MECVALHSLALWAGQKQNRNLIQETELRTTQCLTPIVGNFPQVSGLSPVFIQCCLARVVLMEQTIQEKHH